MTPPPGWRPGRGPSPFLHREPDSMLNDRKPGTAGALVSVVAENIRTLRERKGISLSELASSAGIGKSTLSMLESGKANPNIETLWAIAAAMGVTFGELIEARAPH